MLIIALVLAVIGLAALVFAVVTSNALVAWVCIGASLLGVVLLIIDALAERRRRAAGPVESAAEPEAEGAEAEAATGDAADGDGVDATYENFDAPDDDGAGGAAEDAEEQTGAGPVSGDQNAR